MTYPESGSQQPDPFRKNEPEQTYETQQYGQAQPYGQPQYGQAQPYGEQQYVQPQQQYGQQQPYGGQQQYGQQQYPPPPGYPYGYPQPSPGQNGMGIAGFVCALVGLVLFWIPFFGGVLCLLGLILAAAGMSQGKKAGQSTGLAIAGVVCGIVGLIPAVLIVLAVANN